MWGTVRQMNISLPDEEITIVEAYGVIRVIDGKASKARLEWRAPGLSIYKKGSFAGLNYESAINLALNAAIIRHIPAQALRKVSR